MKEPGKPQERGKWKNQGNHNHGEPGKPQERGTRETTRTGKMKEPGTPQERGKLKNQGNHKNGAN